MSFFRFYLVVKSVILFGCLGFNFYQRIKLLLQLNLFLLIWILKKVKERETLRLFEGLIFIIVESFIPFFFNVYLYPNNETFRKSNEYMRFILTITVGILFGFFIGASFPAYSPSNVSHAKNHYFGLFLLW